MHCPFCSSKEYTDSYLPSTFFNDKVFHYIKCTNCGLIYIDPLPQKDDFLLMYPPSYQNGINESILSNPYQKLNGLRFSYGKQFDLIKKHTSKKRILDFGCGNANFLLNANHQHFECDGVEFNPTHVEILKKEIKNRNFYTVEYFFTKDTSTYDVIRLSNVLEHLENPKEVISKLITKLNDDGILLIEGPIETNFSFALLFRKFYFKARKFIQRNWAAEHPPTHLLFSNAKNQKDFLKNFPLQELHFEVIESEWPFPENISDLKSIGSMFKYSIAKISVAFSKISFGKWGNTFIYIGRKTVLEKNIL